MEYVRNTIIDMVDMQIFVRAMRSLGMRRPVRSPGIQHTSRPDPGDYPSGAAVRL